MKKLSYANIIDRNASIEKMILNTPRLDNPDEQYQNSICCEAKKSASVVSLRESRGSGITDFRRISLPSKLKKSDNSVLARATTSKSLAKSMDGPAPLTRLNTTD